ncbi:MAG TPA: hypothetical protein VNA89_16370 [Gemmatimonadaceae bacterium]|nr:hypothetical protein [Gemmatimonadaceae bacterium]
MNPQKIRFLATALAIGLLVGIGVWRTEAAAARAAAQRGARIDPSAGVAHLADGRLHVTAAVGGPDADDIRRMVEARLYDAAGPAIAATLRPGSDGRPDLAFDFVTAPPTAPRSFLLVLRGLRDAAVHVRVVGPSTQYRPTGGWAADNVPAGAERCFVVRVEPPAGAVGRLMVVPFYAPDQCQARLAAWRAGHTSASYLLPRDDDRARDDLNGEPIF